MKYNNETVFSVSINAPDGTAYSVNMLSENREKLEQLISDVSIPASVDGELGIVVCGVSDATAQEIADILNAAEQSKLVVVN